MLRKMIRFFDFYLYCGNFDLEKPLKSCPKRCNRLSKVRSFQKMTIRTFETPLWQKICPPWTVPTEMSEKPDKFWPTNSSRKKLKGKKSLIELTTRTVQWRSGLTGLSCSYIRTKNPNSRLQFLHPASVTFSSVTATKPKLAITAWSTVLKKPLALWHSQCMWRKHIRLFRITLSCSLWWEWRRLYTEDVLNRTVCPYVLSLICWKLLCTACSLWAFGSPQFTLLSLIRFW